MQTTMRKNWSPHLLVSPAEQQADIFMTAAHRRETDYDIGGANDQVYQLLQLFYVVTTLCRTS